MPHVEIYCLHATCTYNGFHSQRAGEKRLRNSFGPFWYQKQCFGLFSHPIFYCVGLICVNSITFSKNTLLATSVVVPVLEEPMKKALWVITTCNKLERFWYQKQCSDFFASCTLLHGTNWCKVHHI